MFTGIVVETGRIRAIRRSRHWTVCVDAPATARDLKPGASVAVSGVCVTVVDRESDGFWFDLSAETLERTTFRNLKVGDPVNLEPAMRLGGTLDGHIVQGHVDDVGQVVRFTGDTSRELTITPRHPPGALIVEKGSIAIDGVSLTIARIERDRDVTMALIPLTIETTTFRHLRPGHHVNIEYDIIGKYVVRSKHF